MTVADPTVLNMRKASAMMTLKQFFPELTEKQFIASAAYAMGLSLSNISAMNGCSFETTKKQLQRSKAALNLDTLETMRGVFVMRTLWSLL